MQTVSYENAVMWIAENDNDGDRELRYEVEMVKTYQTVEMVSELFGVTRSQVARDVVDVRKVRRAS